MILVGANNVKFGELKDNLSNSYLIGEYQYPKNREGLVSILNNWKGSKKQQLTTNNTATLREKVSFVQKYSDRDGKNGKRVNEVGEEQCHHCKKKDGHWIYECPDLSPDNRDKIKKDGA